MNYKTILLTTFLCLPFAKAIGLTDGLNKNDFNVQIHEKYLQGDFHQTLLNIKTGLEQFSNDPIMKSHLLSLYSELLHSGKLKGVDVGWVLPKEITYLGLAIERENDNNETQYFMVFSGNTTEAEEVKSFKVTRYPDTVVLDQENRIGKFNEYVDENANTFRIRTNKTTMPVLPGLYTLQIKTKSGSQLNAWFIIDDSMNATSNPDFVGLTNKKVFSEKNLNFKWKNFFTPEYNKKEGRELYFEISKDNGPSKWEKTWDFKQNDPTVTNLKIDLKMTNAKSYKPITDGNYFALLQYIEWTRFGDMRMKRKSSKIYDITIKTKK